MKTLILIAALFTGGCSMSVTGGWSADAFYPDIRTAKGGGLGDPDKSRHETTRPSTSHVRNNDGGNAVDRWLFKKFDTSTRK